MTKATGNPRGRPPITGEKFGRLYVNGNSHKKEESMFTSPNHSQAVILAVRKVLFQVSGLQPEEEFPYLFGDSLMIATISQIGSLGDAIRRDGSNPNNILYQLTRLLDIARVDDQVGADAIRSFAGPSYDATLYRSTSQNYDLINIKRQRGLRALTAFIEAWADASQEDSELMDGNRQQAWTEVLTVYKALVPVVNRLVRNQPNKAAQ